MEIWYFVSYFINVIFILFLKNFIYLTDQSFFNSDVFFVKLCNLFISEGGCLSAQSWISSWKSFWRILLFIYYFICLVHLLKLFLFITHIIFNIVVISIIDLLLLILVVRLLTLLKWWSCHIVFMLKLSLLQKFLELLIYHVRSVVSLRLKVTRTSIAKLIIIDWLFLIFIWDTYVSWFHKIGLLIYASIKLSSS